ncbi:hypothetical protein Tco_0117786 [Tanacetum coccineum]
MDKKEDSKALVTVDGEGVDWTTHSEDEDYALMACNSSDSDTEYRTLELVSEANCHESNVESHLRSGLMIISLRSIIRLDEDEFSTVGGKRETVVKPSAGYNWRPQRYHGGSKYNSGSSLGN